jgi:hypothetical protein
MWTLSLTVDVRSPLCETSSSQYALPRSILIRMIQTLAIPTLLRLGTLYA